MKYINNSLSFVVIGDWNQLYTDPTWLIKNIFQVEQTTIEFQLKQGTSNVSIVLKNENISITPYINKFIINCEESKNITYFETLCKEFLVKADSPYIKAYGLNIHFVETNMRDYSVMVDALQDTEKYILADTEIINTQIIRKIKYMDSDINIKFVPINDKLKIEINMNKECECSSDNIKLTDGFIKNFYDNTLNILKTIGYNLDNEEE